MKNLFKRFVLALSPTWLDLLGLNLLGGSKVVGLVRADRLTIAPNALLEDPAS